MKVAVTTTLAALATTVAAAATPATFSLKTRSSSAEFNNLCVAAYHTGAGTADAVLYPCGSNSNEFFVNGTSIYTTAYGNDGGYYGSVQVGDASITYDQWAPVTVDITEGPYKGFTYNKTAGFLQNEGPGTDFGFIVCKWAHYGLPQLFALGQANSATKVIETCALVDLVKG